MKKLYLIILFLFPINIFAKNCDTNPFLKIGLIENKYIDYKHYLYHTLGNYSVLNSSEFEISTVKNNIDEFDIIFGEYNELQNLSLNKIEYPEIVLDFYKNNNILIKDNILPLDLDTFIILSQNNFEIIDQYEFENLYSPSMYTLGLSLKDEINIMKLLYFINDKNKLDMNNLSTEISINFFEKIRKNINDNTLDSNILEVMNSHDRSENLFTLFSDGTLLYKDIKFETFQLFPQKNIFWNKKKGYFEENLDLRPISFYGLSAYINNSNKIGFICYMLNEDVRLSSFKNFNIELSPFSVVEVESIKQEIPPQYVEILKLKSNYIFDSNFETNLEYYEYVKDIIVGKKKYKNLIDHNNYLN